MWRHFGVNATTQQGRGFRLGLRHLSIIISRFLAGKIFPDSSNMNWDMERNHLE